MEDGFGSAITYGKGRKHGFLPFFFDKTYKKCVRMACFLEKMKKMNRERKKIEKNLDIILAKCYNILYCR